MRKCSNIILNCFWVLHLEMSKSLSFLLLLAVLFMCNPNFIEGNKMRTSTGEDLKTTSLHLSSLMSFSKLIDQSHSFRLMDACNDV